MTRQFVAEFDDVDALGAAIGMVRKTGGQALDAFTPFPIPALAEQFERPSTGRIRVPMLIAGFAVAALAYFLQWYSAVIDYPINVGGRPLHSWPVFLLVPFEVGMFAAALTGVIAMMRLSGLPRLHHPLFDVAGFERASQDRFFLLATSDQTRESLRDALKKAGARSVTELRS